MKMLSYIYIAVFFLCGAAAFCAEPPSYELVERSEIGPAWSGHRVPFALLTDDDRQFAAFYDADRNMTLAQRKLGEKEWTLQRLPTKIGWDSHNYVTMILDEDKCLHVAGNMHCVPLIYFRSEKPLDISSLKQVPEMLGKNEKRCTYPKFLVGPKKELIFTYRDGYSGNGIQIWNIYDVKEKRWNRLLDRPLLDGQGKMNAYFYGPVVGPDGFYHISWMWRDTPDAGTNHDLSYARSRDLVNWENSRGEALTLPITIENGEIIDAAKSGEGLINTNQKVGFDSRGRVVVSYGKYDSNGHSQLYSARREADGWKYYQTSDWKHRWDFKGGGTLIREIDFSPIEVKNGRLEQTYEHIKESEGKWVLDEGTLKPVENRSVASYYPKEVYAVEHDFPKMENRRAWDIRDEIDNSVQVDSDVRYVMVWESLPANRDGAHPVVPPTTTLRVLKLQKKRN